MASNPTADAATHKTHSATDGRSLPRPADEFVPSMPGFSRGSPVQTTEAATKQRTAHARTDRASNSARGGTANACAFLTFLEGLFVPEIPGQLM